MAERDPRKETGRVREERGDFSAASNSRVTRQIELARQLIERDKVVLAALAK